MRAKEGEPLQPRVLLVEDHPDVADLYQLKLQLEGYQVAIAADGVTGLELAFSLRPDLILLDLQLPRLNGLKMLALLRQREPTFDVPVVVFTEDESHASMDAARRYGVAAYLIKAEVLPSSVAAVIAGILSDRYAGVLPQPAREASA